MKEDFLHYLWRFRLIQTPLYSTTGDKVEVLYQGHYNTDSGPDFIEAKLKVGTTIWAGNVELHLKASDWDRHGHQSDKAYNTVILHVVYQCDKHIKLENGESVSCLELKKKFDPALLERYTGFMKSKRWIACSGQLNDYPKVKWESLFARLIVERLEKKVLALQSRLEKNKNDWDETFYQALAGGFGLKINEDAFIQLAEALPLNKIIRKQSNILQLEALLFGQAGMLEGDISEDDYFKCLKKEFAYLKEKYRLSPYPSHFMKFLRLRPSNFPNLRISQFASLISTDNFLFSRILKMDKINDVMDLFRVSSSAYWSSHYVWDKESKYIEKKLSEDRINLLLINVLIPFLFFYGKKRNRTDLVERALNYLEFVPPEKNRWSLRFKKEGLLIGSAIESQGLIHLKTIYCDQKKCLSCAVGVFLLK